MLESSPRPYCGGGDGRARSPGGGAKAASVGPGSPWWSRTDAQPRTAWERSIPSDGEQLQLLNPNLLLNSDLQLTEPRDWRQRQGEPEVVGPDGRGWGWGGGQPSWTCPGGRGRSGRSVEAHRDEGQALGPRPGRWGPRATAFNHSKSCFCGSREAAVGRPGKEGDGRGWPLAHCGAIFDKYKI